MRLVFCEWPVIERWVVYCVAPLVKRKLSNRRREEIESAHSYLETLRKDGLMLACTVSGAAHLITLLYKNGLGPSLAGETTGFPFRKSFARKAVQILSSDVELLTPTLRHFKRAEELWHTYCERGDKAAYAQFADYIDAAMVLDTDAISHAIVHHQHIPYILKKARSPVLIHYI